LWKGFSRPIAAELYGRRPSSREPARFPARVSITCLETRRISSWRNEISSRFVHVQSCMIEDVCRPYSQFDGLLCLWFETIVVLLPHHTALMTGKIGIPHQHIHTHAHMVCLKVASTHCAMPCSENRSCIVITQNTISEAGFHVLPCAASALKHSHG
jgi:hypothetical protein